MLLKQSKAINTFAEALPSKTSRPKNFQGNDKNNDERDEYKNLRRAKHKSALVFFVKAHQTAEDTRHAYFIITHIFFK
jgi:hypothetical protein